MGLDLGFASLLEGMNLDALDEDGATILGFWADGRIGYLNPTYEAFGVDGGAPRIRAEWGLGSNVFDATPDVLRPFYVDLFRRARTAPAPLTHQYECPSPPLARTYVMRLHALAGGRGLLASHALVVARPYPETWPADEGRYRDEDGLIRQCAHCRYVRRVGHVSSWEMVPEYLVKMPEGTSHGVCAICFEYHYGTQQP
jgi:hypothetical protein